MWYNIIYLHPTDPISHIHLLGGGGGVVGEYIIFIYLACHVEMKDEHIFRNYSPREPSV